MNIAKIAVEYMKLHDTAAKYSLIQSSLRTSFLYHLAQFIQFQFHPSARRSSGPCTNHEAYE